VNETSSVRITKGRSTIVAAANAKTFNAQRNGENHFLRSNLRARLFSLWQWPLPGMREEQ
jgi:hypothetical protein